MQQATIKTLSENLAGLITRHMDLDNQSVASTDNENVHSIIERKMEAVDKEKHLVEKLIFRRLAENAGEAACQLMLAAGNLEAIKDDASLPDNSREFLEDAYLAVRSALHVVEKSKETDTSAYQTIKDYCASDRTFPFDNAMDIIDTSYPKGHADEHIFRLVKEYRLLYEAWNISLECDDKYPKFDRLDELEQLIIAYNPKTLEGLKCKAEMVLWDFRLMHPIKQQYTADKFIDSVLQNVLGFQAFNAVKEAA